MRRVEMMDINHKYNFSLYSYFTLLSFPINLLPLLCEKGKVLAKVKLASGSVPG